MQRILILILSVLLAAFTIPAGAHCGECEEDKATSDGTAKTKDKAKSGSLEERVASLEGNLKDVSGGGPAGKPFTSKGQGTKAQVTSYTTKKSSE